MKNNMAAALHTTGVLRGERIIWNTSAGGMNHKSSAKDISRATEIATRLTVA